MLHLEPGIMDFVLDIAGFVPLRMEVTVSAGVVTDLGRTILRTFRVEAAEGAAGLSGVLLDPSRAVLAGARIQVSREIGSAPIEAVTDIHGRFFLADLPPGRYQLTMTMSGFLTKHLPVVMETPRVDLGEVILQVGDVTMGAMIMTPTKPPLWKRIFR